MQQKKKYLLIVMLNYFPQNMSEFLLKPIVSCRSHDDMPFSKHNILSRLSFLVTTGNKGKKGGGISSYDFPTESHLTTFTALRSCLAVFDFTLVANYLELRTSPVD